jgi:hypothetical protein
VAESYVNPKSSITFQFGFGIRIYVALYNPFSLRVVLLNSFDIYPVNNLLKFLEVNFESSLFRGIRNRLKINSNFNNENVTQLERRPKRKW